MDLFFIILLVIILVIVCTFTIMQHVKYKKDKSEWERIVEEKCRQQKSESYEYIRQTIDKISDIRHEYENKTEHDILTDIILALAAYSRRIDRIDDRLDSIYNYKAYIDSMNLQVQKISEYFVVLNAKSTELENIFLLCENTLQNTSKNVNILNQHFSDTVKLEESIEKCVDLLSKYSPQLYYLNQQIKQILQDMEDVISSCDSSPITKLKNIENLSEEITQKLSEITSDIEDFDSNISGLASDISTIKSAVDEYGYDSLYSKIDGVKSEINEIKSEISNLDWAISTIRSAVDN